MGELKSIGKREIDSTAESKSNQVDKKSGAREIGTFLREKRQESQFSLDDVSRHLEDVTQEELFGYECGTSAIPLETLFALANLYSILPDQLVHMLYQQALGRTSN